MFIGTASELRELAQALSRFTADCPEVSPDNWPPLAASVALQDSRDFEVSIHLDTSTGDSPETNFPRRGLVRLAPRVARALCIAICRTRTIGNFDAREAVYPVIVCGEAIRGLILRHAKRRNVDGLVGLAFSLRRCCRSVSQRLKYGRISDHPERLI